ncbi:MAG: hypothetical protein A3H39_19375 [candidate division NC10 bacterium RIFCSPLOWO2_02_FULL_66_22]|nr:MAG: hypothetical protein A3H39_19375 [candidate division NC10 bacterium RIFCSPLOWO2_02_FULL_66_22]
MRKVVDVASAVALIRSGSTVAVIGTGAVLEPDLLLRALEQRFLETGEPRDLSVVCPMLPSDLSGTGGMNTFSHPGMLRRIIAGAYNKRRAPRLNEMILGNEVEAYNLGMGTILHLLRCVAGGSPGLLTDVGLGTYLDPRIEGGRLNAVTKEDLAEVLTLGGREVLYYRPFPIDVAIVRGTAADDKGNLSMEEEPNYLGALTLAMAAKNSGGMVIAQVKRRVLADSLDVRLVKVPGILVDAIVVHPKQTQLSPQSYDAALGPNLAFSGGLRIPFDGARRLPLTDRKVIARRAAQELQLGDVVNIGVGLPAEVPLVALEEACLERVTFTNEHGTIGGLPGTAYDTSFVVAANPDAILDSACQFDLYNGGGLNIAFLGLAQVDAEGNVNVSKFAGEVTGSGGFPHIVHRARRIVFCATFTSGGLETVVADGRLTILREGRIRKFMRAIEQLTFNAAQALANRQEVLYVTERAVFRLGDQGLELAEIAPGIDQEKDVLGQMEFRPRVSANLRAMSARLFQPEPMGLVLR